MEQQQENQSGPTAPEQLPPIEDAAAVEEAALAAAPEDDPDTTFLSHEARTLDAAAIEEVPASHVETDEASYEEAAGDGLSDAPALTEETGPTTPTSSRFRKGDWEHEFSAHALGVELRRIETRVRELLDERDPRRKRRFTGTRRWHELEVDLLALRFTGRLEESSLREVQRLVARRHYLFRQLRFVAGTRPTWNT